MDVDLSTGAQVMRNDIDGSSVISREPSLLRLPDGRLFISPENGYNSNDRFLYSPASDEFLRTLRLRAVRATQYSPSPSGRFMLGDVVYDAALNVVDTVATMDWQDGEGALSPDGQAVYLATHYGYEKVRLSDGALLEQVKLGTKPQVLIASPDGKWLLAVGMRPGGGELAVMFIDVR